MTDQSRVKILMMATDGFEQSELFEPREALLAAGFEVTLASVAMDAIQGMKHDEKGDTIMPDLVLADVRSNDYLMLVLPGGVANPDTLRMEPGAIKIIREFFDRDAPVAAICHAPWLLAEADVLRGRTLTSWPSIRTDISNAGATVVDQVVVVDGNLITSRKPDDIAAFNAAIVDRARSIAKVAA